MQLTSLERVALNLFALTYAEEAPAIILHLVRVGAVSRENTGRGFRTRLLIDRGATAPFDAAPLLGGVTIPVGGLTLEFFLSFDGGYASLLEAFELSEMDTRAIDFELAPFDDPAIEMEP